MTHRIAAFALITATGLLAACGGGGSATLGGANGNTPQLPAQEDSALSTQPLSISGTYDTPDSLQSNQIDATPVPSELTHTVLNNQLNSVSVLRDGKPLFSIDCAKSSCKEANGYFLAHDDLDDELHRDANGNPYATDYGHEAIFVNAAAQGWSHQSFGIWADWQWDSRTGEKGRFGLISQGQPTPGNALPNNGSAVFNGKAIGLYSGPTAQYAVESQARASVDFAARSVQFSTTGTQVSAIDEDDGGRPEPGLDLKGTLSYAPGQNRITGQLTSANDLRGKADARFYGPAAQEMGGVFNLRSSSGNSQFMGAFGTKR